MKKILLNVLALGLFVSGFGQSEGGGPGFEFGLRGAAASNWLFNANVSNAGGDMNYAPAFSYNFGLHIAYNFSDKIALEVTPYIGTIDQGYKGTFSSGEYVPEGPFVQANETYTSNNVVKITGIPLLLRAGSGNGAYVEIGPEYDIVNSATYTANYSGQPAISPSSVTGDASPYFAKSSIMGVLGFGDDFQIGSSGLNIVTCLRFYYGFTDLIGVDGLGQNLNQNNLDGTPNNAIYKNPYPATSASNPPYYASYKPTHAAGASFTLGAYYYIPVTTSKGGRHACKHPPRVRS